MSSTIYTIRVAALVVIFIISVVGQHTYAASSDEFYKNALKFFEAKDYKSAVIELKNALQKNSENRDARLLLGLAYVELGDGGGAEKELLRAKKLGVEREKYLTALLRAYVFQNNPDAVLKDSQDLSGLSNQVKADIYVVQAQAYLLKNNPQQANTRYTDALKITPDHVEGRIGKARMAILQRDLNTAETVINTVLKEKPQEVDALVVKGEVHRLKGEFDEARRQFVRANDLRDGYLPTLLGLTNVYIALEDYASAISISDSIIKAIPNHPMANYLLAISSYRKGDTKTAEKALTTVLSNHPSHVASLQLKGAIHYRNSDYAQADLNLTQVVEQQPDNLMAVKMLAASRIKLKQFDRALNVLKTSVGKVEDDAQFFAILGSAYMLKGDTNKGVQYLQQAVEISPDSANIHTQLAMAQLSTGAPSKAVKQLETAIELDQDLVQADVMLALIHMQRREFDKALQQAKSMQNKQQKSPIPPNLIGAAYMGMKQYEEALRYFNQALKLQPKFIPARLNIARVYEHQNKFEDAQAQYQKVLEQDEGQLSALISMARIEDGKGHTKQALNLVEKARSSNPQNPTPGLFLAQYYLRNGENLKALSITRDLTQQQPHNVDVLKVLGMAQAAAGENASAVATFESIVQKRPTDPESHYLLAKAHIHNDNINAASKALNESLKIDATYVPALLSRAEIAVKQKNYTAALEIADEIQRQQPDVDAGYLLEGDIRIAAKSYPRAFSAYEKGFNKNKSSLLLAKMFDTQKLVNDTVSIMVTMLAWIEQHPNDASIIMRVANEYQEQQKNDQAIEFYKKALQANANNIVALNNVAWLLFVQKNANALSYAEKAYALNAENPAIADTYGWILVQTGDVRKGLAILKQAVLQAPKQQDIRYHLAYAMYKAGDMKSARKELETVFKQGDKFPAAKEADALLKKIRESE